MRALLFWPFSTLDPFLAERIIYMKEQWRKGVDTCPPPEAYIPPPKIRIPKKSIRTCKRCLIHTSAPWKS